MRRTTTLAALALIACSCSNAAFDEPDAAHAAGSVDAGSTSTPCGSEACGPGLECCNASCGICAAPGEGCVDVVCAECGGAAGATCPPGQYCDFAHDAECGADGSAGRCRLRPSSCEPALGPLLCGCDGRDYLGVCEVHAAGTDVARWTGGCSAGGDVVLAASRECAPDDGASWRFVISSARASCGVVPSGERIEVHLWHELGPPTSSNIGGAEPHGAAMVCAGPDGPCVEATGHFDVSEWVPGSTSRIAYELLTPDGVGRAATDVSVEWWCGVDPPLCG